MANAVSTSTILLECIMASNQQVIEYLNKQLTERDLKTFAPLSI